MALDDWMYRDPFEVAARREALELHQAAFQRYCEKEHRAKHGKYRIKLLGVKA